MQEQTLKDLLTRDWIKILNESLSDPAALPTILQKNQISVSQLSGLALSSKNLNEPYGRRILYKSPQIEVMLAKWSFAAAASPHNHGFSKGLIWFLKGDFCEQQYEFRQSRLQELGEPVFFTQGSVTRVVSNDIHSCCPIKDGISLHLYSPAIEKMKVWDLQHYETLTVADECGAWVPQNENLIIQRVKWA